MALQGSGQIKLSEIGSEFSDSAPHQMSEFYAGGARVGSWNSGVPTSGQIKHSNFYGATSVQPIIYIFARDGTWSNFSTPTGSSTITVVGAGAAGGSSDSGDGSCSGDGGGGGGGGAIIIGTANITSNLNITIGAGSSISGPNQTGPAGGASSVTGTGINIVANGGSGGVYGGNNHSGGRGAGGAGGSVGSTTGLSVSYSTSGASGGSSNAYRCSGGCCSGYNGGSISGYGSGGAAGLGGGYSGGGGGGGASYGNGGRGGNGNSASSDPRSNGLWGVYGGGGGGAADEHAYNQYTTATNGRNHGGDGAVCIAPVGITTAEIRVYRPTADWNGNTPSAAEVAAVFGYSGANYTYVAY